MKKIIFMLLSTVVLISLLGAQDFMQPRYKTDHLDFKGYKQTSQPQLREQAPAPNYSFIPNSLGEETVYLYDSYYDYMPFSYNGHNIRIQPEVSLPYGWSAGGIYVSYMVSETTQIGADRKAWNSYINSDGSLSESSGTNHYGDFREGYTSIAMDPVTGNPFFAWHAITESDNTYDVHITYDNYLIAGASGYWKQPFILFDNPEVSESFTGHNDDEFLWPVISIGDSPTEGYRRIHAYANNATKNSAEHGNYNSIYAYADFNADSLLYESSLIWSKRTFSDWDNKQYNDIDRVNKDIIVKDNIVAFFGSVGDSLFVKLSYDYGETFQDYKEEWLYPIDNPQNQDGSYAFYNTDETTPSDLFMALSNDGTHYNGVLTDSNEKIVWMSGVNLNTQENRETELYIPAYFYPKIFSFDMSTHEFDFYDMVLQGADPDDDLPMIPWDLDENGIVDEFLEDTGEVYVPVCMVSWFFNSESDYGDSFFHESNFKMIANGNWVVAAWHDCTKHRFAYFDVDGFEDWLYQPEIVLSISDDGGQTWSDPRYFNANAADSVVEPDNNLEGNYEPALADMIPTDITFGDKMEIISNESGNYHAKVHIGFFDDNDYGSAAGETVNAGDLNGGKVRYAALDIEFLNAWNPENSSNEETITPQVIGLEQNYPNPFNPTTLIRYSLKQEADVEIEVYNLKGQKVKTLVNDHKLAGNYDVTWKGNDNNGRSVASGIYFYRLKSGNESGTKKMVLMK